MFRLTTSATTLYTLLRYFYFTFCACVCVLDAVIHIENSFIFSSFLSYSFFLKLFVPFLCFYFSILHAPGILTHWIDVCGLCTCQCLAYRFGFGCAADISNTNNLRSNALLRTNIPLGTLSDGCCVCVTGNCGKRNENHSLSLTHTHSLR